MISSDSLYQSCRLVSLVQPCSPHPHYGSIGWAVGAALGCAIGGRPARRRVVACIGDGSFQLTSQEVSTMLRYNTNPAIILVNNGGYTIEVGLGLGFRV